MFTSISLWYLATHTPKGKPIDPALAIHTDWTITFKDGQPDRRIKIIGHCLICAQQFLHAQYLSDDNGAAGSLRWRINA